MTFVRCGTAAALGLGLARQQGPGREFGPLWRPLLRSAASHDEPPAPIPLDPGERRARQRTTQGALYVAAAG
jgi:hypothetical protein